jgi:hypothetical protein
VTMKPSKNETVPPCQMVSSHMGLFLPTLMEMAMSRIVNQLKPKQGF